MYINNKPRIIISTDIGGRDEDDFQSLVHYLVYADMFDTEGIISSPPYEGRKCDVLEVLKAYSEDYGCLKTWGDYPTYKELVEIVFQGALDVGEPETGKSTQGSQAIINAAARIDPRPLYVLVWGSLTDVAQALFDEQKIGKKIRVYSIGSWNTVQDPESRKYIYENHKHLWWIENDETFRGMYMGGNQENDMDNSEFVKQHVSGHGALGRLFVKKKSDIKMGDTPSVLYMLSPLVGDIGELDDPESESWGGSFKKQSGRPCYWQDREDDSLEENGKKGAKTVNKWREAYLRDWQKRMDRCASTR